MSNIKFLIQNYVRIKKLVDSNSPKFIVDIERNMFREKISKFIKYVNDEKIECKKIEINNLEKTSPCNACRNYSFTSDEPICSKGHTLQEFAIVERGMTGCVDHDPIPTEIMQEIKQASDAWNQLDINQFLRYFANQILHSINEKEKDKIVTESKTLKKLFKILDDEIESSESHELELNKTL